MKASKMLSALVRISSALVLSSLLTISSSAGLGDKKGAESADPQALGGTVTGVGLILVDGTPIGGPTRVTSGSSIYTGADGDAMIDLGTLGTIRLRPNGSVKLQLSASNSNVLLEYCTSLTQTVPPGVTGHIQMNHPEKVEVGVTSGRAFVNTGTERGSKRLKLKATTNKTLYDFKEVTSDSTVNGQSIVTVSCCQCCFVEKGRK